MSCLSATIEAGRLSFTTDLAEAVEAAEIIFLALPTPPGKTAVLTSATYWAWPISSAA